MVHRVLHRRISYPVGGCSGNSSCDSSALASQPAERRAPPSRYAGEKEKQRKEKIWNRSVRFCRAGDEGHGAGKAPLRKRTKGHQPEAGNREWSVGGKEERGKDAAPSQEDLIALAGRGRSRRGSRGAFGLCRRGTALACRSGWFRCVVSGVKA